MNKLEFLQTKYPNELNKMIDVLYRKQKLKEIGGHSSKTTYKFKVLGKEYVSDIVSDNYISFIKDVSNVLSFDDLRNILGTSWVSRGDREFRQSHKVNEGFIINKHSSTEQKIKNIKKICNYLDVRIDVLDYWTPSI